MSSIYELLRAVLPRFISTRLPVGDVDGALERLLGPEVYTRDVEHVIYASHDGQPLVTYGYTIPFDEA